MKKRKMRAKNKMCDGRKYISISIKADVYDILCHLSKKVVPGTQLSIPKVIEVITRKANPEKIEFKKDDQ
ncbi:hypothetical protein MCEMIE29_00595 [Candidatus Pelagibacterales bacterium]|jgi:hypothetical protein